MVLGPSTAVTVRPAEVRVKSAFTLPRDLYSRTTTVVCAGTYRERLPPMPPQPRRRIAIRVGLAQRARRARDTPTS